MSPGKRDAASARDDREMALARVYLAGKAHADTVARVMGILRGAADVDDQVGVEHFRGVVHGYGPALTKSLGHFVAEIYAYTLSCGDLGRGQKKNSRRT